MHSQENYKTQVGQGPYMPPPAFQQRPGTAPAPAPLTPLTFHHGPLETQQQVIRPGNPSFPLPPGNVPYTHILSGTSHQGPDMPVLSSGMNSGQSYLIHPYFPQTQGSTQSSHSYPTYGPQPFAWSQNVHQIPPTGPLPTPRPYLPPSSQGYPMERGLLLQPPSHHPPPPPPPPPPPYSSSSSFSTTDPFGSSVHSVTQHSYVHSMGALPPPPPPPPPPPLPPSSPPGVPPLPPSSPPSDNLSNNDGSRSSKEDLLERSNLMLKRHPLQMKPAKDKSAHDVDFTCQSTEIGPEVEKVTHSPADSDMDMEG